MYAITGKLLEVDLTDGRVTTELLPESLYREYLGGYGIGLPLLLERMDPACDPLAPENILGFAAGYLTGTGALIGSRFMVFGKSPSTGGWGDANCGGFFGKGLKRAGFDTILFSGCAEKPVYLLIDDGQAELKSAEKIWGMDCYDTEDALKELYGKACQVACIGPAGENLSAIAGISTDKGRLAARSGLGAVMGSKKLKAVVVRGKQEIGIADPDKLKALREEYLALFRNNDLAQGLSEFGTPLFYEGALMSGDTPVKNWSGTHKALGDPESISAIRLKEYKKKPYGCSDCPIACGGKLEVKEGKYKTRSPVHKAEYETLGMLGPNLLNENIESLIKLNDLCNRMGLDTIGCGALVAFALECFENKIIDKSHTDGLQLTWGNTDAIITLVEQMGRSEGIGGVLAKGFNAAIEAFGPESRPYAMAVRNEALPAHDPRWSVGLALTYYTDPTPARHTQGSTTFPVAGYQQPEFTNDDQTGRAPHHKRIVNLTHALSATGLCLFGYIILDYKTIPDFLSAIDGTAWSLDELEQIGFRISMARQLFNLKAGVNFKKSEFPKRVLGEPPLSDGPTKNVTVELDNMVKEYIQELGLNPETTEVPDELLTQLNLAGFKKM